MDEIEISIKNRTPFSVLSQEFPDLTIFRWCSSIIDYVEMYGHKERIEEATERLKGVTERIHSFVITAELAEDSSSTAISCRCSVNNSTIRLAESMNLLWEAPAIYKNGEERLRLISFSNDEFSSFFDKASSWGTVRIIKKKKMRPDSLRDVYSISLKELFGSLSSKQALYFRDAIVRGMFSSPKRVKVEKMANIHGISKSTMQEHLRKAENKLIRSMEPYLTLYIHPDTDQS
ncbi:MAG: helix-turn-helix domain-containing protein [Thermoplasmatales archaeon]|jgi:predicted DNA binding protein|nr:helix-turn-helix domain-containing protein [Candidatus Thermoplasmatota archaeon]MCL6002037.1 helix-turn-helix domain-containing protein [Candidatus Thermoplasmatota archaeon]MDA8054609.1 helix-turn-helix domain-containing protein [Thermoplasmatales archaeon]